MILKNWLRISILLILGILSFKLYSLEYYVQIHKISQKEISSFEAYLRNLRKIGISGAFLRVFQNKGDRFHNILPIKNKIGVYFDNESNFPIVNPIANNLNSPFELYFWMSSRWMDWVKGPKYGKYLILQNKDNRKTIISTFSELSKVNSNGILIQDDLIIKKAEEKASGLKSKELIIEKYISEIKKKIGDKELIVNVYYEVPLSKKIGVSWYGQSIDGLLNAGADYLAIMLYHRQIKRELKFDNKKLTLYIEKIIKKLSPYSDRSFIKLQIMDFKTSKFIPQKEILKIIKLIPKNFKGVILTPITTNKKTFSYLSQLLSKIKSEQN